MFVFDIITLDHDKLPSTNSSEVLKQVWAVRTQTAQKTNTNRDSTYTSRPTCTHTI